MRFVDKPKSSAILRRLTYDMTLVATARWARCRYICRFAATYDGINRSIFALWNLLIAVIAAAGGEGFAVGLYLEQPEVSALIRLVRVVKEESIRG
jgi:hypothetical protein